MRLIDADALDYRNDKLHDVSADFIKGIEYMHERITDAPTIDAVSVIRCEHCRHGHYEEIPEMYVCDANGYEAYEAGHYCSYGERKEGE